MLDVYEDTQALGLAADAQTACVLKTSPLPDRCHEQHSTGQHQYSFCLSFQIGNARHLGDEGDEDARTSLLSRPSCPSWRNLEPACHLHEVTSERRAPWRGRAL